MAEKEEEITISARIPLTLSNKFNKIVEEKYGQLRGNKGNTLKEAVEEYVENHDLNTNKTNIKQPKQEIQSDLIIELKKEINKLETNIISLQKEEKPKNKQELELLQQEIIKLQEENIKLEQNNKKIELKEQENQTLQEKLKRLEKIYNQLNKEYDNIKYENQEIKTSSEIRYKQLLDEHEQSLHHHEKTLLNQQRTQETLTIAQESIEKYQNVLASIINMGFFSRIMKKYPLEEIKEISNVGSIIAETNIQSQEDIFEEEDNNKE
ncbi:MAG: hypothetical protein Q4Q23_06590 [Methanobacteriaceae archaeon]|nr:hypothetical protein [Methanobacteriaceae archaeon]